MIPWDRAWQEALYATPGGFYRHTTPATHFATAVQGIPGSTAIMAEAVTQLADHLGCPAVVDLAAGRGELAAEIAHGRGDLHLTAIDVVPRPAGLPEKVAWHRTPGGPNLTGLPEMDRALVIAHEWLDVVPCPIWQIDGRGEPRVVLVASDGRESLGAGPGRPGGPLPADLAWCERWWPMAGLPEGARIEVGRARDEAWAGLLSAAPRAVCLAVDYGHTRADRPPYGTLLGFRGGHPVPPAPDGRCDLTAHVAVDSLAQDERHRQRDLLLSLGVDATAPPVELAGEDPPRYLARLTGAGAAARLLDPAGLGGFHWVLARPRS